MLNDLYNDKKFNFKDSKVYFLGSANHIQNISKVRAYKNLEKGLFDFNVGSYNTKNAYLTSYDLTIEYFINDLMRQKINFEIVTPDIENLFNSKSMPAYPNVGYIKNIDDKYLVKLSD